ncbi:MAG: sel1 repeat family protein, partial [Alphaproteobacteria bacterium]|nr:sel1 repeat family protein [Alphaproteobacteria bacterium]
MRWLGLLVALIGLILSDAALAVPNGDAEQAYARGDYATAFKIWFQLAEQGSVQAQRNIARMYERGEWVAQDSQAAKEWYDRAAAQ